VKTIKSIDCEKYDKREHQASARYPLDVSEFDEVGLRPLYKNGFKAPYVEDSPVQVGFKLIEVIDVDYNSTHIVVGEIVELHLKSEMLMDDGFVDLESGAVVALSGLDSYHGTKKIHRLSYAKPGVKITEI